MSEQLIIRFIESSVDAASTVTWHLLNSQGQHIDDGCSALSTIVDKLKEFNQVYISVIVPAESTLLATVSVPSTQLKQVKRALPFVLEELVTEDIESLHIATAQPLKITQGQVDVAAIAHQTLVDWLDQLHSCGLSPDNIIVDVLSVPREENAISILLDGMRVLIRSGDYSGLVVSVNNFDLVFTAAIAQQLNQTDISIKPTIKLLSTADNNDNTVLDKIRSFIQTSHPECEVQETEYSESTDELLAVSGCYQGANTLNFLQGGYAVNREQQSGWHQWRLPAAVAGISVLAYLLITLASGLYFDQQAEKLERQSMALYKQLFPNERRVVSPKKQMQNHLRTSQVINEGNFLQLLADTAGQLAGPDNGQSLTVEQMRYDGKNGQLQIEVKGQSIDQFDKLKQKLSDHGLQMDINSAIEQDNTVLGKLVVRAL